MQTAGVECSTSTISSSNPAHKTNSTPMRRFPISLHACSTDSIQQSSHTVKPVLVRPTRWKESTRTAYTPPINQRVSSHALSTISSARLPHSVPIRIKSTMSHAVSYKSTMKKYTTSFATTQGIFRQTRMEQLLLPQLPQPLQRSLHKD